jgi:hypothetical protein
MRAVAHPIADSPCAGGRAPDEPGSVTVELAAAIPLLVAVALALVAVIAVARDQVLALGAAREAAREAALSGDARRAADAAHRALPSGTRARVTVTIPPAGEALARVELTTRVLPSLPAVTVRATAVAAVEPGPTPAPAGMLRAG